MKRTALLSALVFAIFVTFIPAAAYAHSHTSVSVYVGGPGFYGHYGYYGGHYGYYGHGDYWYGYGWGWYPWYPGVVVVDPVPPVVIAPSAPVMVAPQAPAYGALPPGAYVGGMQVPDYDGLNAIGQRMRMQQAAAAPQAPAPGQPQPAPTAQTQPGTQPAAPAPNGPVSQSDKLFDEGVKAFAASNYATSTEKFRAAVRLDPNDREAPFVYAQSLFAQNEYEKAAAVLLTVLNEIGPNQPQEISYPRGLYKSDALLDSQVKNLERAVGMDPQNAELHLLLGYHYIGLSKTDVARTALAPAIANKRTQVAAQALVNLADRLEQAQRTESNAPPAKTSSSAK
jgi:hypothetical protein